MSDYARQTVAEGRGVLGIEFGSTRIKAVLIGPDNRPIAQGSHGWENRRTESGLWTYTVDDILSGLQACYADLAADVRARYGVEIERLAAIGISAMMHGYMPFDRDGRLLTGFRTWRCTNTGKAAAELCNLFGFNIPLRWSISHLRQAILDGESHVGEIASFTTLAGYVHRLLSGENVLGIGDASGMLPVDSATGDYDSDMIGKFDTLVRDRGYAWLLADILPRILPAGADAGSLTPEGARLLDPTGKLQPGAKMCPPEGDAGTGMVATNAVRPRTGNVSAGTSSFSMIVLERPLNHPYEVIDMVTTPDGKPVAMVHCNNCTSDLNAWTGVFDEYARLLGVNQTPDELYGRLYNHALEGDADCGNLVAYNFISGEPVAGLMEGRPLVMRPADSRLSLANFIRAQLNSAIALLAVGNKVLFDTENVAVDRITGHGGFFKTPGVGQRILSAALRTPISVMETAGEGGAWGMALLASYMVDNPDGLSLPDWLDARVFDGYTASTVQADHAEQEGFNRYLDNYMRHLPVEQAAVATDSK